MVRDSAHNPAHLSWYSVVLMACVTPSILSTIEMAKSYVGYTLKNKVLQ